jgi:competence protein ComFC
MRFLNTLLDIVFPVKCILCRKSGVDLCLECLKDAPSAERESASWIFPLYDYRHPAIKKSLWLLKYKGKKRLANVFAEIIYEKILEELSELSTLENFIEPILIPIPLSPKRYRERGFNQAELICREIIKIQKRNHLTPPSAPLSLKPPYSPLSGGNHSPPLTRGGQEGLRGAGGEVFILKTNILIKPRDTEHQARIKDRRARLKNLSGSFTIKNEKINLIKNKNIILIDDILTTGATLSEAKKVLKQNGARKVIAFTVAH